MSDYFPTIGLEIHAELKTRTKMFCDSKNDPDETRPNVNICPVCLGHPGTLPVINREAVRQVLRVGVAVGGNLADCTEFDRKNYFYPDIPKGYQISQYASPLVSGGALNGVAITRVHLEEDTATLVHEDETRINADGQHPLISADKNQRPSASLVDFNRAGVPLMELVTEPVIHSAKEAANFARELQLLLRYLGASDANMEKGEMRVEANISVAGAPEIVFDSIRDNPRPYPRASAILGTKVEVKNLNSFRAVERAIDYEVKRQSEILLSGEEVIQETRGWDEDAQQTFSQRRKEEAHDYRYFPDPDLPKLLIREIPEFTRSALRKSLPELPWQKRSRLERDFGLGADAVSLFIEYPEAASFLQTVARTLDDMSATVLAVNYITSDLFRLAKRESDIDRAFTVLKFKPESFVALIRMIQKRELSSRGAKDILAIMYAEGGEPAAIANSRGLIQKSDETELKKVVQTILDANAKVVADYRDGKKSALQFLIGQGMKATRGSANPETLSELIRKAIG